MKSLPMKTRILLLDDDSSSHVYNKIMIEESGIECDEVISCYAVDEVIEHLKMTDPNMWPHIIIADLNMPQKTGWDFIDEYRLIKKEDLKINIYLVTNSENPRDVVRANNIEEISEIKVKFLDADFFKKINQEIRKNTI